MSAPEITHLITGTHAQFERYCRDNKLRVGIDAHRIGSWRDMAGRCIKEILFFGTSNESVDLLIDEAKNQFNIPVRYVGE